VTTLGGILRAVTRKASIRALDPPEENAMTKETKKTYPSIAELEKNFAKEAAWADARYGPHVSRLTKPGRPRKGAAVEKTQPHSIRVTERVWLSLRKKAKTRGLSTNAALQVAAMEWLQRDR
jgi:hypothetical protein